MDIWDLSIMDTYIRFVNHGCEDIARDERLSVVYDGQWPLVLCGLIS